MVELIVNLMLFTVNLGDTPLSTLMRVISEKINWGGKSHPECSSTTSGTGIPDQIEGDNHGPARGYVLLSLVT